MIKKYKIIFGFLFLSVIIIMSIWMQKSQKNIDSANLLHVGTSADYPPYEFKDKQGNIVGFDIDVISEVAFRLGKIIKIKDMPFSGLIFGLLSKDIDVIAAGMTSTPRRLRLVNFSINYISNDPFVVVSLKNKFVPISLQDLKGKNVAVNTGHVAESLLSGYEGIYLTRLKTPAEALIALKSGSVQAFVCAQSMARAMLAKIPNKDLFAELVLPFMGDGYAFAFNKKSKKLMQDVNKALQDMYQDGTLDKIKNKWNLS